MIRKSLVLFAVCSSLALAISLGTDGDIPSGANLSASAIVDKNVAARGGLQAWRAVHTMSFAGKMGAGGNRRAALPVPAQDRKSGPLVVPTRPVDEVQLPFVMEVARPRKMRFELVFNGQTAVRVFDGANAWKLRPFLNRGGVDPFPTDKMKASP